ncbi:hypothetical protein RO3G_05031 [Rhizopus delemar RA 99-880]|uniref:CHCH domain-containing protein n=1 Tax=Rhizopus delemar (strain RA 99-880 / ATCC MYA-4621 / FGSC 9543 / NRRL 43880) TaxID=246409 RepID=I1BVU6_RHIO9|nr:hypothetical protein RO3G_05031 [Rhizopus delemar RA 99-880]|eukprot:EIE80326.1 hypothetical protein RO3G_05031 [Rhizopus delemar RA 99-880]
MAFGRTSNVESSPGKAPLLGSFPLDHDENKNNNGLCRQFSKAYLQCRMDK